MTLILKCRTLSSSTLFLNFESLGVVQNQLRQVLHGSRAYRLYWDVDTGHNWQAYLLGYRLDQVVNCLVGGDAFVQVNQGGYLLIGSLHRDSPGVDVQDSGLCDDQDAAVGEHGEFYGETHDLEHFLVH